MATFVRIKEQHFFEHYLLSLTDSAGYMLAYIIYVGERMAPTSPESGPRDIFAQ